MLGFVLGIGCVLAAISWEGGQISAFVRLPVLVLVLGGSLGATLTSHSPVRLWRAWRSYRKIRNLPRRQQEALPRLARYAGIVRHQGPLKLDTEVRNESEPVIARALAALADGASMNEVECLVEAYVSREIDDIHTVERYYEALGGACPTFGLIGTVIGLVCMLAGEKQADIMSRGIAGAFVATFYGMMLANVLFLPLASRAREAAKEYERFSDNLLLGIKMVQSGTAPRTLMDILREPMGLGQHSPENEVKPVAKRVVSISGNALGEPTSIKKRLAGLL